VRKSDQLTANWTRAIDRAELARRGRVVVRFEGKQIALFDTQDGVFACNNRCPHEGYPLREGTLDQSCVLTCNWHNWKFDLKTGHNLLGGDRLTVYRTRERDGVVWVDVSDPPFSVRRAEIMVNLRAAFDDNDYARLAREIARLALAGGDPLDALRKAIVWSHDKMEFGMTHAFAGAADWMTLFHEFADDGGEARLICLLESVGHMADDVLREPFYRFQRGEEAYDEDGFVEAVDREDQATAIRMIRGALAAGLGFPDLERGFSRAALKHYNDFGHSLIYTVKVGQLVGRLGPEVLEPLVLALVRSLVYAVREDRIPEFRHYGAALDSWVEGVGGQAPDPEAYRDLNVKAALELTAAHGNVAPEDLYRSLLAANADHMLHFDLRYQSAFDRPVQDNVGWLDFTHAITFGNAVRRQCARFPELWPAGLLQMACFAGRNAAYTDPAVDEEVWAVDDPRAFFTEAVRGLFDHGREEFIVSVHLLKTILAAREEILSGAAGPAGPVVAAALNRFLHAPLKRKHVRRTARQALEFVRLDG
jgi:nitrite reductase/ring-hydroxylating ferredoxin subunit